MKDAVTYPTAAEAPSNPVAALLRWFGAGAVALSAVVFLLQGLDSVELAVRQWSYLALMGALAATGFGARMLMEDAKSARLLLGLAVALIPIQFAQLGGMLHSLAGGAGADALSSLLALEGLSVGSVALTGAVTLILYAPVTYAGFAVLVRPSARRLVGYFVLPCLLLLLPWRDEAAGFVVLGALALLTALADLRLSRGDARFATLEGRSVRCMLLLPLIIAAARMGFHVDALAGYCSLLALAGGILMYAARHYLDRGVGREMLLFAGVLLVAAPWALWSLVEIADGAGMLGGSVILVPLAGLLLLAGRLSAIGALYRLFGVVFVLLAGVSAATFDGASADLAAGLLGLVLLVYGVLSRERAPTVAGAGLLLISLVLLGLEALALVTVGSWVTLAVAGIALVVIASLVERFGTPVATRAREGWHEVVQWR